MKNSNTARTRAYSFLVPAMVDGMLGLVQTAVPLLAIRLGATAWFLGILGGIPQLIRVPFCLFSGALSDKLGRMGVIICSAAALILATIGLSLTQGKLQVLITYSCLLAAVGAFYPSLLAFIGDRSLNSELRGNLLSFNMGWTIGGSLCAISSGFLFTVRRSLPFVLASMCVVAAVSIVLSWSRIPESLATEVERRSVPQVPEEVAVTLLTIARVSHAVGFFGFGMIRNIFPKLGNELKFTEGMIGVLVGMLLVGQALGMLIAGAGPWWHGKFWPFVVMQGLMSVASVIIYITSSSILIGFAILVYGISLAIIYTGIQYYSLMFRVAMGKNSGISESLIAGGIVFGSITGGWIAQNMSLRMPYLFLSVFSICFIIFNLIYWYRSAFRRLM